MGKDISQFIGDPAEELPSLYSKEMDKSSRRIHMLFLGKSKSTDPHMAAAGRFQQET